jgi:hypothetical protein
MGGPSLRIRCQGREFLIDRPTIEFTWMVAAGDFPLLLVDIIDELFQFLTRFSATHCLVLPPILHEGARSAAVLRWRQALPRNADRVLFGGSIGKVASIRMS